MKTCIYCGSAVKDLPSDTPASKLSSLFSKRKKKEEKSAQTEASPYDSPLEKEQKQKIEEEERLKKAEDREENTSSEEETKEEVPSSEALEKAPSKCPMCGALNPMPLREVSMPRDYRERVEQVLKEKVPDKLVEEGAPIHHASLGLLVGIVSAILIGLLFLYVFKNFIQAPSKASQDLYELQEVPKYYDKSK